MSGLPRPGFDSPACLPLAECRPAQLRQLRTGLLNPCADHQFVAMLNAYRDYGGLARMQEVLARFKGQRADGLALLTSSITSRQVICFEWHAQSWLPLFQFNRFELAPRAELGQLFSALVSIYDDWALAKWFVLPHPRLTGHAPVECLQADRSAVLRAAHADRMAAYA